MCPTHRLEGFVCGVAPQEHTAGEDRRDPLSVRLSSLVGARDDGCAGPKAWASHSTPGQDEKSSPLVALPSQPRAVDALAEVGKDSGCNGQERFRWEMKNKCKTCGIGLGPFFQCPARQSGSGRREDWVREHQVEMSNLKAQGKKGPKDLVGLLWIWRTAMVESLESRRSQRPNHHSLFALAQRPP